MSTQETPERPRERRRHLTVLSVAAAVLLAGGGGAYWASNASDDSAPAARDGSSESPEPLALDGIGREEAGDGGSRSGIAPGEPAPGGKTTYRADGKLPGGPDSASVFRHGGSVSKSEVAAVAKALGVPGTPKQENGRWTISNDKKGGPQLSVGDKRAAGMWSFTRQSDLTHMSCGSPNAKGDKGGKGGKVPDRTECSGTDKQGAPDGADRGSSSTTSATSSSTTSASATADDAEPVSEDKAKEAVRPALEALGLKGAELDASSTHGKVRVVDAEPQVDGLPTHDWGGTFTVGPDGEVTRAHGRLGDLTKGDEYPVLSAGETLKELNKHGGPSPLKVRCAAPPEKPKSGTVKPKDAPDAVERGGDSSEDSPCAGTPKTLSVTKAKFGLATKFSDGKPVLVPSWIYEVQRPGSSDTYPVSYPAVESKYLDRTGGDSGGDDGPAGKPSPGDTGKPGKPGQALNSYAAEGRTLTMTFWGGVCHKYEAKADESGDKVTVSVKQKERDTKKACVMMAKKQTVKVTLDKPVGDREVVDARDGDPLPQKK